MQKKKDENGSFASYFPFNQESVFIPFFLYVSPNVENEQLSNTYFLENKQDFIVGHVKMKNLDI